MEVCKSCGAFLMEGWERCRICGHDPAAPAATPEAEPQRGRGKKRRDPKEPKPVRGPKEPTTAGTLAMFVVLVAAMVGAGYLFWYQPQQEEEAERAAARAAAAVGATTSPDPAGDTSVPVDPSAVPGDTSATSDPSATTPGQVVTTVRPASTALSGAVPTRQQYAIAIGTIGRGSYPNTSADAWTCAGGLTIDALGGPDAVFAQGVAPADFEAADVAGSGLDERLVIPAGALDLVASGLRGCGIDGEELFIASLNTESPEQRACIVAGLDGTLANQALARQLVGGAEALTPGTAFYDHLLAVALGCGQGGP